LVVTFLLMLACYVTVYAFAVAIAEMHTLEYVMETIIWINFWIATMVGIPARFTGAQKILWQVGTNYEGAGDNLVRFKMLTHEAPYYAMLLAPLVLYCIWRFTRERNFANARLLAAILIPLMMSQSFSIFACVLCALVGTQFYFNRGIAKYKWMFGAVVGVLVIFLALPSTSNTKKRLTNLVAGQDTSASIHLVGSYTGALAMAKSKSIWFGVGLGETKEYAARYMVIYDPDPTTGGPRIAAAVAETLGEFGIVGLIVRFSLEIFFFLKTRPDQDRFRLSVFICIFVLQFGAGSKTLLPEYVMWVIAYSQSCGFFSVRKPAAAKEAPFAAVPQLT
jgi:hypothetical protein